MHGLCGESGEAGVGGQCLTDEWQVHLCFKSFMKARCPRRNKHLCCWARRRWAGLVHMVEVLGGHRPGTGHSKAGALGLSQAVH